MCLSIAFDAICCAGASLCSCACCCCKACCGTTFKEQVKLAYIFLNLIWFLVIVGVFYFLSSWFGGYESYLGCDEDSDCLGVSNIYRISFVLMCMYIILFICMLIRGEIAKAANEGLWGLKLIGIFCFFIGCCFIGQKFFDGYVYFAITLSGLYMLFQIIMLIDVFYLWGQAWIKIYDEGGEYMQYILIITTIILYGIAITLNVFNFIWFSGCAVNIFMNIFTLLLMIGITIVQLLGYNPQGSLLTSSAMTVYIVYQAFSAQSSYPNSSCNKFVDDDAGVMISQLIVGLVLNIAALMYLTFGTADQSKMKIGEGTSEMMETKEQKQQDKQQEQQDANQSENQQQLTKEEKVVEAKVIVKEAELEPYDKTNQYVYFHLVMFVTVIYMSTLITNWGEPSQSSNEEFNPYNPNELAYWIKMITSWLAAALYIWTLIAPMVFPDRNFN